MIRETCNPFNEETVSCSKLLNIASGKTASKDVEKYLTNILENGRIGREQLKKECIEDPNRFLKPIKRLTVKNFPKGNQKSGIKSKVVHKSESMRDSFANLASVLAEKAKI